MTNREWLLNKMQNMSDEELAIAVNGGAVGVCSKDRCSKNVKRTCITCKRDWFKSEHKEPTKLSDAERVILENIDKEYKWICRDGVENVVWVYTDKPTKNGGWWMNEGNSKIGWNLSLFSHLFQFIKWEDAEPYNIEELLKG